MNGQIELTMDPATRQMPVPRVNLFGQIYSIKSQMIDFDHLIVFKKINKIPKLATDTISLNLFLVEI